MNPGVFIGLVAFILWSSVSSWWYVCKIKALCFEAGAAPASHELYVQENEDTVIVAITTEPPAADELVAIQLHYHNLYFKKNSDQLTDPDVVKKLSLGIQDTLGTRSAKIIITGHTCDLGKEAYNHALGLLRAEKVSRLLQAEGIVGTYEVFSKGEREPKNLNTNEAERAANRRVELEVKTDTP